MASEATSIVFAPPPRSMPSTATPRSPRRALANSSLVNAPATLRHVGISAVGATKPPAIANAAADDVDMSAASTAVDDADKPPLHIEVRMRESSTVRVDLVESNVRQLLEHQYATLTPETALPPTDWAEYPFLRDHVDRIYVAEASVRSDTSSPLIVLLRDYGVCIHVYQPLSADTPVDEFSAAARRSSIVQASQMSRAGGIGEPEPDQEDDMDGDVMAASVTDLPAQQLEGLWDALVYDSDVKKAMLNFTYTSLLLCDCGIDVNLIASYRTVLLHGSPGTGKTSLCRALAQKLSIRLSDRFSRTRLVEINAHSLFSKWFSESGKLVQRLFARVHELCDERGSEFESDDELDDDGAPGRPFIIVLIDEVESLTAARAGAMSGKEPSDALRVVNALLTQLDQLKARKNVLVLTTSNLPGAIDGAFVDRCDIKFEVPLPPTRAVYTILRSCLLELVRALGMSGRSLRRLPVLAHARHIGMGARLGSQIEPERWLAAMAKTIEEEAVQMAAIECA